MLRTVLYRAGAALLIVFVGIQLIPRGRDHTNPPITGSPDWDSPRTEELARRACFDCHSHETKWPWYASIAPLSWKIQEHVEEGRSELNFSTFDKPQRHAHEAAEMVEEGEMPLKEYRYLHPESRLSADDKEALIQGLLVTFGGDHD